MIIPKKQTKKGKNRVKTKITTKKVAFMGVFIALAMVLSFVESQVPLFATNTGLRVGLPNIVMMFLLYKVGWKETVFVNVIRTVLMFFIFGNVLNMILSLSGAALSLVGIILLKKTNLFSCITVSIVGGVLHNIGQIIAVCIWYQTPELALELPLLLISGTIAGTVIGLVAGILVKRLEKWKF